MQSNLHILLFIIPLLIIQRIVWTLTDPRGIKYRILRYKKFTNVKVAVFDTLSLVAVIAVALFLPFPKTHLDDLIVATGLLIFITGFIFALWGRFSMKENWASAADNHDINRQKQLVTTGAFRLSRNPIYIGLLLLDFGALLALKSYLLWVVILYLIYFNNIIRKEEILLKKYFGKQYLNYKKNVRRYL